MSGLSDPLFAPALENVHSILDGVSPRSREHRSYSLFFSIVRSRKTRRVKLSRNYPLRTFYAPVSLTYYVARNYEPPSDTGMNVWQK